MAGRDSGPITSRLQPYRLTRVIPLNTQLGGPLYQETWEQGECNHSALYIQELPYDWKGFTVFMEKDNLQPSIGVYDNLQLPATNEETPLQQSESATRPLGLLSPNEPSKTGTRTSRTDSITISRMVFSMCSIKRQACTASSHTGTQTGHSNRLCTHAHKGTTGQRGYYPHRQ